MPEDAADGQDFHSDFAEVAGLAAIAAVRVHMHQSVPTLRPEDWDGETGQWGMAGLEALHDHFHYSEGTVQEDIREPESRSGTGICSISKKYSVSTGCEGNFGSL